ncbi:hypothetical protein ACFOD4_05635 [Pseudoroseomonas globiformis]|uniref:Lectin n=1 Tax=Teichococcus globiformis TaxID=2307229 RepID=A0ABV7FZ13_9PROT
MHSTAMLGLAAALLVAAPDARSQGAGEMTFFVTSANPGEGANLGGLAGADAHCQSLALAAGAGNRGWRAYLSSSATGNAPAVHARDRIGPGPWRNAKGEVIAQDVASLHGPGNRLSKQTALTEKGEPVNGRGDTPNNHDILTGSQPDGTAFAGEQDRSCGNWTLGGAEGSAMVGHHDRLGLQDNEPARSWNSSHASRGCSLPALRTTGGAGLIYCFAAD